MPHSSSWTRRRFLWHSATAAAVTALPVTSGSALTYQANERLSVALVGVSGRGGWFVDTIPRIGENVVALCDVNQRRAAPAYEKIPQAERFRDFRRMFDRMGDRIDAVVVAVPDHTHAVISNTAIKLGKHAYCEKPLTQYVGESRVLRENAQQYGVATQMGNQGTATHAFRRGVELVQAGVLGEVREVFVWKDGAGSGERPLPQDEQPVPEYLDWDTWLGPARYRPYHEQWMHWHRWRDFATGNLGNWGSHSANMAFMSLKIGSLWDAASLAPERRAIRIVAEVESPAVNAFPRGELIRWSVPQRENLPPLAFEWFAGAKAAGRRDHVEQLMGKKLDWGDAGEKKWADHAGCLIHGPKAMIHATGHNSEYFLLPEEEFEDFEGPPQTLPRSGSHEREWLAACKGGPPAMSSFDYASRLIEFLMLGNVATLFPEEELVYDPVECRITNHPEANAALRREYRTGWSL